MATRMLFLQLGSNNQALVKGAQEERRKGVASQVPSLEDAQHCRCSGGGTQLAAGHSW